MPNVQIKNVPVETHAVLTRRAKEAHQSLQEYLLTSLIQQAAEPSPAEWVAGLPRRRGRSTAAREQIVDAIHAERERR